MQKNILAFLSITMGLLLAAPMTFAEEQHSTKVTGNNGGSYNSDKAVNTSSSGVVTATHQAMVTTSQAEMTVSSEVTTTDPGHYNESSTTRNVQNNDTQATIDRNASVLQPPNNPPGLNPSNKI
jgi:hypothetical protein